MLMKEESIDDVCHASAVRLIYLKRLTVLNTTFKLNACGVDSDSLIFLYFSC